MPLQRRNGRFQVFSRLDKESGNYVWTCARVERGQLHILFFDSDWHVVMKAAQMMSQDRIGEFQQWLTGYNSLTRTNPKENHHVC